MNLSLTYFIKEILGLVYRGVSFLQWKNVRGALYTKVNNFHYWDVTAVIWLSLCREIHGLHFNAWCAGWIVNSYGHTFAFFLNIWVIPCQINKEVWVTSRILTKLIVFVVSMVLTNHTNFWPHTWHSFWFMTTNILNIVWKIGPFWVTKSTIVHHCGIIIKWKFQQLKTVDRPFQQSEIMGYQPY